MIILAWQRYHADNLNEFNVKVYQPKPPEESESSRFFLLKFVINVGINQYDLYAKKLQNIKI